jgi:glyoxylase-like metal-dependent hydrolase (beta-lactamase superfamily II)
MPPTPGKETEVALEYPRKREYRYGIMQEALQPPPRLEDNWMDLVEKARWGQRMDRCTLCARAGISVPSMREAERGAKDEEVARGVARVLGLGAAELVALLRGDYDPPAAKIPWIATIATPHPTPGALDGTVNAYLVQIPGSANAILVDGGSVAEPVVSAIEERNLAIRAIFVTHTHPDHVAALPTVHSLFPEATVRCAECEKLAECMKPIQDGETMEFGTLSLRALATPGHSSGGMSYFLTGLVHPVVFTGDALFAGSVGRADGQWKEAIGVLRDKILTLPLDTVILPGHGPATTVAYEAAHNPALAH